MEAKPEDEIARRAGQMAALAAEDFNPGLRAYYFALAAVAWFVNPVVFILATLGVVAILFMLEFRSNAVEVHAGLRAGNAPDPG